MKNVLRLTYGLCISTLLFFSGLDSSAQNGPNLLVNADFANVKDLATNKYGKTFVWPDDWVLVSDSLLWNQYPTWKVWYGGDGTPFVGSWTGVTSVGTMYQEVTGLANGTYEFTLKAAGGGANDSKYALFTTGYGGDSVAVPFYGNAAWTSFSSGPINIKNGKCKVGINVKNGSAGDYIDCVSLDFHAIPAPVVMDTIRGANLLVNADFTNVTDLATNKYSKTFVWPDEWMYKSDSVLWNQYPIFKIYWQDPTGANIPTIGCWTGVASEGRMYQDVTGLANGLYEFSFTGAASGSGDSKYTAFLTGYGGDSIHYLMPVTNKFVPQKVGPINVTNGKCRVGLHVKNGTAGDWNDIMYLNFHSLKLVPTGVESLAMAKIRSYMTNGQLNLRFDEGQILDVDIYSITGQLISSTRGIKSGTFTKALSAKGILIVKVNTSKGVVSTKVVNQ